MEIIIIFFFKNIFILFNIVGIPDQIIYWDGQNWARSCDFNGNDLSHIEIPPQLCGPACLQTEECTHYTWTKENGGTCWMKKGNVSKADAFPTNDTTMICGVGDDKGQEITNYLVVWNGADWAKSCDFHGNNLSQVEIPPELCGPTCLQTKGCTHYTWTTLNGGTCWMKKGNISKADAFPTNDTTMVCGINKDGREGVPISNIQWNGQNWATSCDFNGNDLSHVKIKPELCGPICLQTQECTHYTWTTLNGGTCWMKKGNISKADAFSTNDTTMVCGVNKDDQNVVPTPTVQWNGQTWARSCDFNGNDLSHVEISPELCGPTCLRTKDCTHYTWTTLNGGTCWMKTGSVSKNDAISTNDPDMICGITSSE
ncbi:unnamed protein product [Rotaria sp. Silwood1]|nr:unnamed protein product [Rotaria sp. Silwood1]CAF3727012.1 unnamed protein product [Rotaria sp. Silwood1]CAF4570269.1 unnamed protein product [Rotaria sp. Silwood1]CAF4855759.1 unnamed protein product [Rotaria sp. Silwood1]